MFKTSVYISNSKELNEDKILDLIKSKEIQKKIEGMKEMISYVSQGKGSDFILHTVLKEVLLMENNELKRLFYYFLEIYVPLINEEEILLLNNQIRKDLESPNEFIRGLTLKFVSTLRSKNVLNNCYKAILENIKHSVGYVRRNTYNCLGVINIKLGIFEETHNILYESLHKELDPFCLIQAYNCLWAINKEKAISYAYEVKNSKGKEFSILLIEKISDPSFLKNFIEDQDGEVRIESCMKLLELNSEKKYFEKYVDYLFHDIKEYEEYFEEALNVILKIKDFTDLSKHSIDALYFINPFNPEISKVSLRFVFNICKSKDVVQILEYVLNKYHEIEGMMLKNKNMEVLILEELSEFIFKFRIYNKEIKKICLKNVRLEDPALSFASLKILSIILEDNKDNEIINSLVQSLIKIKYGKILRFTFNIFSKYVNSLQLEEIFNIIDTKFKVLCHYKGESDFLIFQKDTKFLIPFVCISLTEIFLKFKEEKLRPKFIAMFLGFTKLEDFCNSSTKSTIFLCIKSLATNIPYEPYIKKKTVNLIKNDVLEPLKIPFLDIKKSENLDKLLNFLESEDTSETLNNVVQLTGLSDPIYSEANILYTRYEIILNILLINQTENYLQNMLFDFGTSPNIQLVSLDMPENMKARSAIFQKIVFRIIDSSSGFINGSVTFKYPNENGEYANQNYTLNFSEIKTDVSDYLETKLCKPKEFKLAWKKMAWENVYSIKLLSSYGLRNVFDMFNKFVKGTVIDYRQDEDILVANIICTTRQNDDIFFNVCIAKNENFINLECRIRSGKEDIVKSMSNILGKVVKEVRVNN